MPLEKAPNPAPGNALRRSPDGRYVATRDSLSESDILAAADAIIERRFLRQGRLATLRETKRFLRAKLIHQERELFGCLFFDHRQRVITWEVLFQGTVDTCAVYCREVVKRALQHNSSFVILAHQHPSGDPEPSAADQRITRQLRDALATVDICLLDHIVIGASGETSLAQRGML